MKKTGLLMSMLMGLAIAGRGVQKRIAVAEPKPFGAKTCVRCGKKHDHHNVFCSAECAHLYKVEQRAAR